MNLPTGFTPDSDANVPAAGQSAEAINNEVRQILQDMYARQQQMETELARARSDLDNAEAERRQREAGATNISTTAFPDRRSLNDLLATLTQAVTALSRPVPGQEPAVPRDWKPPTWDGHAETFRDYLLRMRGSYRVRSASKPTLPREYYWNAIYDTLPSRERARMRHFWEKGSAEKGKDPDAFFAQLEDVFADTNEQAKALERLTTLKHSVGQPWHEHQLEFDGLLLSAGGDSWADLTKIGYLKNTFSNPAKLYTAAVAKTSDYYVFSEEVERIMTNLEGTDQFKAAYKRWAKEKARDSAPNVTVTAHPYGQPITTHVDADGDTMMAPIPTNGGRRKGPGNRRDRPGTTNGRQRARWVDNAEREKRREKRLCFRCGAGGHRVRDCPYAPAVQPTSINSTQPGPLLEDDDELPDPDTFGPGKA
jgi:hypothetical protein